MPICVYIIKLIFIFMQILVQAFVIYHSEITLEVKLFWIHLFLLELDKKVQCFFYSRIKSVKWGPLITLSITSACTKFPPKLLTPKYLALARIEQK